MLTASQLGSTANYIVTLWGNVLRELELRRDAFLILHRQGPI